MDKNILAEITERAKRLRGESTPTPPAPEWSPNAWLCSSGTKLENVTFDGKCYFIGTPGKEFHLHAKTPPGKDFAIKCYMDGREVAHLCWTDCRSSEISIRGFQVGGNNLFPFKFASSAMSNAANDRNVTSNAGQIKLVFIAIRSKKRVPIEDTTVAPPANLVLKKSDQKFFHNPGLTVNAGDRIATKSEGMVYEKIADLGEVVYYYDTDERLRLRGIIPEAPVPVPSAPPAPPEYEMVPDYQSPRMKRAKTTTFIDITGDEIIITEIKVE